MNEQRYNAFISYRRTEHDTAVAKEIQNSLERFRVPRGIRSSSGKERIDRIFRDQEELSITSTPIPFRTVNWWRDCSAAASAKTCS